MGSNVGQPWGDGMGCIPSHDWTVGIDPAVAPWVLVFAQLPVSGSEFMVSIATWHLAELLKLEWPESLHF